MNLLLLLPIGLAALASLLLPLLVHLARRSEPRVLPFAALRWLRAQPQPRRRHRFEEWLLLLLRLLLLAALALLLAQPVLFGHPDRQPWVVVAPQLDLAAARQQHPDTGARWHRLTPGFPVIDSAGPPAATPASHVSLFSLLRELDATLPAGTPLTVLVPQTLDDADAQRPILSRKVDWIVVSGQHDQPPARAAPPASPTLVVRFAPERAAAVRYLRAAGTAWASEGRQGDAPPSPPAPLDIASASTPLPAQARHLAWLVPGPVPQAIRDWVTAGGTVVLDAGTQWPGIDFAEAPVAWQDDSGPLARRQPLGRGQLIRLERALMPAALPGLLEPDFPQQLQRLLTAPAPPPARVEATDVAPQAGLPAWPERPRPLSPWLVWAIAGLFLLERLVASGRRRSLAT